MTTPADSKSQTQLAQLLSDAYKTIDILSARVKELEALLPAGSIPPATTAAPPPTNGHADAPASSSSSEEMVRELHALRSDRDAALARRVAMTDQWHQLRDYLSILDSHSKAARLDLDRLFEMDVGVERVDADGEGAQRWEVPLVEDVNRDKRVYREGRKRRRSSSPSVDSMIIEASGHPSNPYPSQTGSTTTFQTHVFAPVVTGAPQKRSKGSFVAFTPGRTDTMLSTQSTQNGSTNSVPTQSDTKIYPPTNELGQRICRACGQPGRYKEDKCVEKWGPGPMGPGTVCDRCRKKIKRVERKNSVISSPNVPQVGQGVFKAYTPTIANIGPGPVSKSPSAPRMIHYGEADADADAEGEDELEPEEEDGAPKATDIPIETSAVRDTAKDADVEMVDGSGVKMEPGSSNTEATVNGSDA